MDFGLKLPTERVEAAAIDWTFDKGQPRHGYVEVNVFYAGLQTALQRDPPPHYVPVQLFPAALQ